MIRELGDLNYKSGNMRVHDLMKVIDFPIEVRIKDIQDTYTVLRNRLNARNLPIRFRELVDNIQSYCDLYDELDLVSVQDGIPEIKLKNIDIRDLVVLRITNDWVVYVGWKKNH